MKRIAVIFDNQLRPETTGLYVRRALGEMVQAGFLESVEHLLPGELDRVVAGQFDLFLYVDDGIQNTIREDLRPAVWWGIDSHLDFERCLKMAAQCDVSFTAQRELNLTDCVPIRISRIVERSQRSEAEDASATKRHKFSHKLQ
ncbi:hypothetical protein [Thalassoglobus sp.]|uniref:hypothetical protein n=1 Tax=Thalassoglobus sp. TaxID=2795869 RepID=UPI003AA935FF